MGLMGMPSSWVLTSLCVGLMDPIRLRHCPASTHLPAHKQLERKMLPRQPLEPFWPSRKWVAATIVALSTVLRFLVVWFSTVSTMTVFLGDALPRAIAVVLFNAVVAMPSLPDATLGGAIIRLALGLHLMQCRLRLNSLLYYYLEQAM